MISNNVTNKVVKKVVKKKSISKISKKPKPVMKKKKSCIPEILLRGDEDKPVVISVYSNREVKKRITFETANRYLYVDLVGKDASKKVYLRFNLRNRDFCDDAYMIKSSMEEWKLWKTEGLEEYMGTSEYELVTRKGYSLNWSIDMHSEHVKEDIKGLFPKESVPWCLPNIHVVKLVPSTSVVSYVNGCGECGVCKLPTSKFFKMDKEKMFELLKSSECSKAIGKCFDCAVEKLKFKNPVVCRKCKNEVNVLGLTPYTDFCVGSYNKCFECIVSDFYMF